MFASTNLSNDITSHKKSSHTICSFKDALQSLFLLLLYPYLDCSFKRIEKRINTIQLKNEIDENRIGN